MSAEPLQPAEVVKACLNDPTPESWQNFMRLFQPAIASGVVAVVRQRLHRSDPSLVDDLIQDTYLKIWQHDCKALHCFVPRGDASYFGYFKVIAINCCRDHFDKNRPEEPLDEKIDPPAPPFPIEDKILIKEMDDYLEQQKVSQRDRDIFWLHRLQGFSAREIALLPNLELETKGVESVIYKLTQMLREAFASFDPPEEGGKK